MKYRLFSLSEASIQRRRGQISTTIRYQNTSTASRAQRYVPYHAISPPQVHTCCSADASSALLEEIRARARSKDVGSSHSFGRVLSLAITCPNGRFKASARSATVKTYVFQLKWLAVELACICLYQTFGGHVLGGIEAKFRSQMLAGLFTRSIRSTLLCTSPTFSKFSYEMSLKHFNTSAHFRLES